MKISVDEATKTNIEVKGDLERIMNDAINIIGHLVNQIELIGGPDATKAFISSIPLIILDYRKDLESGLYQAHEHVISQNEEEQHENDTL